MTETGYVEENVIAASETAPSFDEACRKGRRMLESGRMAEAESIFRGVLSAHPAHADSLHLLGFIAYQSGNNELATDLIGRAILLQPEEACYYNTLGNVSRELGRLEESAAHLRIALSLKPDSPEINSNLGSTLMDLGRSEEALAHLRSALHLNPHSTEINYNLANTLQNLGYQREAEVYYRKALALKPDFADAHYNLGNALMALCRPEEAKASYLAALRLKPDYPQVHNNLGNLLYELNRLEAAESFYRIALSLKPEWAETHYNLGCTLLGQNRIDEAAECYQKALDIKPGYGAARLGLCMAQLPVLYADQQEIPRRRHAYADCLRQLSDQVEHRMTYSDLFEGVGANQPFYLAYQGHNDRELQSLYGSLVCRTMAEKYPPSLSKSMPPDQKVRIGIVSGFFEQHTVWRLFINGWLSQLDRRQFEVFCYHTGNGQDAVTETASGLCDRFVHGRLSGNRWRETILADRPHVLLYPEIGMDPMAARLAAQRLAHVQCTTWGHPQTSGFPTIDYFLSSELMEPPDGQSHYTERLIRLPNLSIYFEPTEWRQVQLGRSELGLRSTSTVYWSGQALYKYLPRFDPIFPLIAREVGDCQFVFIEYAKSRNVTELFKERLKRAFSASGLDADKYCVILPKLEPEEFVASVGLSDVILDTIGWSGGLSTLDCLTHDIPIVTMTGSLMRSRHTAGMLKSMDATDTVTETINGYVSTAVRLAGDPAWRDAIKGKSRKNKYRLYRDRTYITALEHFLNFTARNGTFS